MNKLKNVVLMWLPEEQQRLPLSPTAVCTALLFVRNSPSLAPTTQTFICYLCIICVVKANSARRRSMYAQVAGSGRREDANIRWDSADWPTLHLQQLMKSLTWTQGSAPVPVVCRHLGHTWRKKGVRIGWKGRDRRRFNRCASESHQQMNGIPLMVGRWCAEVNRNHVNAVISLHLSHRCRFL